MTRRLLRALGPQFEVRRLLGRGGFADVFEVWDGELQRRLAVKVLRPDILWTSGMLARFKQETRAIARLSHPNILPIHFVGEGEGIVFYAMPYVEGQSLAGLLRTAGALDPDRAVAIARPIIEALEYAHQHGIVHRDIKPDNVMLETTTGRVLLLDFGVAKWVDGENAGQQTQAGLVVGTPQYMSPEQALGQGNIDHRTDIYALGAMLFQMVTGAPPFDGDTSQEIVGKHISYPVPSPASRNGKIPRWLSDVIVRCLAKRPADRYQSAGELLEAIGRGEREGGGDQVTVARVASRIHRALATLATRPADTGGPLPPPRRRAVWPWALAALAAAALVVAALQLRGGGRPLFTLENRLLEPVRVSVNGGAPRTVAAGEDYDLEIPEGPRLQVDWELVRPASPTGKPLGEELRGTVIATGPTVDIRHVIVPRVGEARYFAPIIGNNAAEPVRVSVGYGGSAIFDCECLIPPGAVGARVGYYRLEDTTSIRVVDARGGTATYSALDLPWDPVSGSAHLQVEPSELSYPPSPPEPPAPQPQRDSPTVTPLPLQVLPPVAVETVYIEPPRDTMPTPDTGRQTPRNPLQGIFPR